MREQFDSSLAEVLTKEECRWIARNISDEKSNSSESTIREECRWIVRNMDYDRPNPSKPITRANPPSQYFLTDDDVDAQRQKWRQEQNYDYANWIFIPANGERGRVLKFPKPCSNPVANRKESDHVRILKELYSEDEIEKINELTKRSVYTKISHHEIISIEENDRRHTNTEIVSDNDIMKFQIKVFKLSGRVILNAYNDRDFFNPSNCIDLRYTIRNSDAADLAFWEVEQYGYKGSVYWGLNAPQFSREAMQDRMRIHITKALKFLDDLNIICCDENNKPLYNPFNNKIFEALEAEDEQNHHGNDFIKALAFCYDNSSVFDNRNEAEKKYYCDLIARFVTDNDYATIALRNYLAQAYFCDIKVSKPAIVSNSYATEYFEAMKKFVLNIRGIVLKHEAQEMAKNNAAKLKHDDIVSRIQKVVSEYKGKDPREFCKRFTSILKTRFEEKKDMKLFYALTYINFNKDREFKRILQKHQLLFSNHIVNYQLFPDFVANTDAEKNISLWQLKVAKNSEEKTVSEYSAEQNAWDEKVFKDYTSAKDQEYKTAYNDLLKYKYEATAKKILCLYSDKVDELRFEIDHYQKKITKKNKKRCISEIKIFRAILNNREINDAEKCKRLSAAFEQKNKNIGYAFVTPEIPIENFSEIWDDQEDQEKARPVAELQNKTKSDNFRDMCVLAQFKKNRISYSYSYIALGVALSILGLSIAIISAAGFSASCGASSVFSVAGILLGKHIVAYGILLMAGATVSAIGTSLLHSEKNKYNTKFFQKSKPNVAAAKVDPYRWLLNMA